MRSRSRTPHRRRSSQAHEAGAQAGSPRRRSLIGDFNEQPLAFLSSQELDQTMDEMLGGYRSLDEWLACTSRAHAPEHTAETSDIMMTGNDDNLFDILVADNGAGGAPAAEAGEDPADEAGEQAGGAHHGHMQPEQELPGDVHLGQELPGEVPLGQEDLPGHLPGQVPLGQELPNDFAGGFAGGDAHVPLPVGDLVANNLVGDQLVPPSSVFTIGNVTLDVASVAMPQNICSVNVAPSKQVFFNNLIIQYHTDRHNISSTIRKTRPYGGETGLYDLMRDFSERYGCAGFKNTLMKLFGDRACIGPCEGGQTKKGSFLCARCEEGNVGPNVTRVPLDIIMQHNTVVTNPGLTNVQKYEAFCVLYAYHVTTDFNKRYQRIKAADGGVAGAAGVGVASAAGV